MDLGEFSGTDKGKALRNFANFVVEVLPFLYAKSDAPSGTRCSKRKLCTNAICCLLGVSRSLLYGRKCIATRKEPGTMSWELSLTVLVSDVDNIVETGTEPAILSWKILVTMNVDVQSRFFLGCL